MRRDLQNPFNITKADDFSNQEINDFWLDISGGDGFSQLIKPTSPTPMLVLGGKGSGKTHLLRYLSAQLQSIRHGSNALNGVKAEGHLGIYLICSSLNAARFRDKGQPASLWSDVFAYSMELWLAQLVLSTVSELWNEAERSPAIEQHLVQEIFSLFDRQPTPSPATLADLIRNVATLRREVDFEVGNCSARRAFAADIAVTRGRLIFGIPQVFSQRIPQFERVQFLYLLDEFENFSAEQQKYVQTLLRERQAPSSFKIGARMYGIRTYETYCADEENKEGSEYEVLRLDSMLRQNRKSYIQFSYNVVQSRLRQLNGVALSPNVSEAQRRKELNSWFEARTLSRFAMEDTEFVKEKYVGKERPYFLALRGHLEAGVAAGVCRQIGNAEKIGEVIDMLRCADFPLLEKINLLIFYRHWSRGHKLIESAASTARACQSYLSQSEHVNSGYGRVLHHFKADMLAQLFKDCERKQQYVGLRTFIDMSWGLPRNMLNLLRNSDKTSVL